MNSTQYSGGIGGGQACVGVGKHLDTKQGSLPTLFPTRPTVSAWSNPTPHVQFGLETPAISTRSDASRAVM